MTKISISIFRVIFIKKISKISENSLPSHQKALEKSYSRKMRKMALQKFTLVKKDWLPDHQSQTHPIQPTLISALIPNFNLPTPLQPLLWPFA